MAFYNEYPNRKDWRKPGRVSTRCNPHGGCPHCLNKRMYQQRKETERTNQELREFRSNSYLPDSD